MKTSEDKLNEALRDVLKRKFDDYEEQPNANALERIRARVKPARRGRYWWFTGALVLLSVSGILVSRFAGESKTSVSERAVVHAGSEAEPATSGYAEPTKETLSVSKAPVHSARSLSRKTIWKIPVSRSEKLVKSVFVKDPGNQPASEVHRGQAGDASGATVSWNEGLPPVKTGPVAVTAQEADHINATLAEEAPAPVDSATAALPLEELASMSLKEMQIPLHLRGVVAPAIKPAKVIVTNPTRMAWLFNASALHSYQILTVPSSAAQDFQNFSFPTLFTARSMGYKISGGVERNGIQLQLHYSGFRQTYSYEIANNNYLVKPDDKGQYQTVRQGDRVEENRKFSMLGIGVTKQLRWGHSTVSRFYAAFGAEYSHDLKSSQSLGWVSLGLGKQFAASRHTAFSIGPYAEFSPVKVKGTQNPFYYQPYRVGISAGLRFVRP
ncbi:hypothetical protein [Dyadobacter sp. BHUBP1]|uniref:hypothetical protein n=1 Tax=Dyadobacter sp. BHUBP1 TaxID=3424178 RepID=UPI003D353CE5